MQTLFLKLFNMGIAAGWLSAVVLILRLLLKKAPRALVMVLWVLVGIRLIVPVSLKSMLSLVPSAQTVPPEILYAQETEIHSGFYGVDQIVNPIISESIAPNPANSVNPAQVILFVASVVWVVGVAAMLTYTAVSYLCLRRKIREAAPVRENIWICDRIHTPFILGIIKPRIFLPSSMEEAAAKYVIAHEKAHLRRLDHWWKPLGFLLLSLYWFHPVYWICYGCFCRDIERACDEKVIRELGETCKKPYAETLIACSVPGKRLSACPLAFGERNVKGRVKCVLNYKKPAFWIIAIVVPVCIALAVLFLTNPINDVKAQDGQRMDRQIRKDYTEQYWEGKDNQDFSPEDLSLRLIVQIDDIYVLFIDGPFEYATGIGSETVNGLTFRYNDSQRMQVYRNGEFYSLPEAFENGVLSDEQLLWLYEKYAYKRAEHFIKSEFYNRYVIGAGITDVDYSHLGVRIIGQFGSLYDVYAAYVNGLVYQETPSYKTVAGIEFYFPTTKQLFICKETDVGVLMYDIGTAYEKELITKEDLHELHRRINEGTRWEEPTYPDPIILKTGEYFVNEVRNSDNELSNADCSVKLLANNKFTLYMGWGQWYEGSYEIRDEYLNCRAMILEWDGGGGPGSESADVLFQFRIVDENKLELVAAENQDPTSERHSFGEGFIIGMTYSKK